MKDQIKLAQQIATGAHEGQFRWDGKTPYISHPAAIAKSISSLKEPLGPHFDTALPNKEFQEIVDIAVAAAWLHDVVEDTPLTIADLRRMGIKERILTAVDLLTKKDGQSYLKYLLELKVDPVALLVKVEDIKHNMSDLDRKKRSNIYDKYQLALHILGR